MNHQCPIDPSIAGSYDKCVLPSDVIPSDYVIELHVNLNSSEFFGLVIVEIAIVNTTNKIVLNAKDLSISRKSLLIIDSKNNILYDDKKEQISFEFLRDFQTGMKGSLYVYFQANIGDKLIGFYKSTYNTNDGTIRRAFPCWDEPDKKAKFTISLQVRNHLTALSNMNENVNVVKHISLSHEEGWKIVSFATSVTMSTYLVAFVVGEIEFIEAFTKNGNIPVRVYAPIGFIHQGHFALDVGVKTLDFFTEYFGESYPLPKMDMIAIPDFASGAMENWGLVTYRMTLLLFDDQSSTLKTKQQVAYVVGHELAHQWFGNLVTMQWWSDLWLNEGFATWAGWLAADHIFPKWEIWTEFVVDDLQSGLALDSLRSSHPIEVPVRDPSEISQIFDSISYSKGASVIRMLEAYLGPKVFQKGLQNYIQKHLYSNARTDDLWAALDATSGKDVTQMMALWTRKIGVRVALGFTFFLVSGFDGLPSHTLAVDTCGGAASVPVLWRCAAHR
ncbi:hypothetical protein DI09_73p40 [Mitosporidium daphniae]|uniref:Uncharacterized protein n=1 Tax=Mitosporidium daphniae TaxID=1485682 RepID=A0A098VRR3_9MICR|nr:uncharacterized protein DI09_73p40 [Mitosporidium daphniae]KGG50376.1 hypothetical protein DI09_73p40 [Mitosporidium daphniae]|eukprot:XP_013236812.1 uncharacterized protein DI09_73p40 [Mitosporidium daphniae]